MNLAVTVKINAAKKDTADIYKDKAWTECSCISQLITLSPAIYKDKVWTELQISFIVLFMKSLLLKSLFHSCEWGREGGGGREGRSAANI